MNGIIAWVLSEAWPYILAVAGAMGALLLARQSGKSAIRKEIELESMRGQVKAREEADAIRQEVERMDDDAVLDEFDRLHNARRR